MVSLLVVGSVAFDALESPYGKVERALGGAATYFAVAASFFAPVSLVAIVGDDFTPEDEKIFRGRQAPLAGKIPRLKVRFPGQHRTRLAAGRASPGQEAPQNRGAGYHELLD